MKNIKFNDLRNGLILLLFGAILSMLTYVLQDLLTQSKEHSIKLAIVETKVDILIKDYDKSIITGNNLESTQNYITHPLSITDLDSKSLDKLVQQDII